MRVFRAVSLAAGLLVAGQLFAADPPVAVATGRNGQTAWEFVGTIKQSGVDMTMTGYLTAIAGLRESQLFDDPAVRSASTARFKINATGKMTTRNVMAPLFVLNAVSVSDITFGMSGSGPSTKVASTSSTLQTVIDVTAPAKGVFNATGELVRTAAENFTLDDVTYRFGEANRVMRITMVGDGALSDPAGPVSTIVVAGRVVVGDYLPQQ